MPGYTFVFVDKMKKKHVCPLCSLPMKDPAQITTCGHCFCDDCLQKYLRDGVFVCPEDTKVLDYAQIYPNYDLELEIQGCKIKCIHHEEGCRWVGVIKDVQVHLDTCRYDTVACLNHCGSMLSRICLEDHIKYTCPRRVVTCESCNIEFSGESMETHQGNCPMEIVWCENKCGARLKRHYLSNHMSNECHKRTMPCRYCKKQFVYETLQDHFYHCLRFPVTCPNRCDPTKIAREDVENHIKDNCPSASIPCPFKNLGCKYMCPRYGLDKHMEQHTKEHLSLTLTAIQTQEQTIQSLLQRLTVAGCVNDGYLIWRIHGIRSRLADAKSICNKEFKSEPFYTSRYGYKLSASIFFNGNGSGEGTHLSLYIRMMAGEYDPLLEWPFRLPIMFSLLDQCFDQEKRQNLVESFVPNPTWKHFQRPSQDSETMGFGYPKFVSHDTLKSSSYIKEDCLFIKIKVDLGANILP